MEIRWPLIRIIVMAKTRVLGTVTITAIKLIGTAVTTETAISIITKKKQW